MDAESRHNGPKNVKVWTKRPQTGVLEPFAVSKFMLLMTRGGTGGPSRAFLRSAPKGSLGRYSRSIYLPGPVGIKEKHWPILRERWKQATGHSSATRPVVAFQKAWQSLRSTGQHALEIVEAQVFVNPGNEVC
jgi:hypothetical protein